MLLGPQCLFDCVYSMYMKLSGYRQSHGSEAYLRQELIMDQLDTRLVQLELLDRRCLNDARRHHASKTRTLFRSKMLEHRRLQGQMAQLQRFKENAMTQFDALSNHELNRTFVKAMQGVMSSNKGLVTATREDAETVMEDLQESVSQVKDLTEFLGQPMVNGMTPDEVTDEDLEMEFATSMDDKACSEDAFSKEEEPVPAITLPPTTTAQPPSRIKDMLRVPQMLVGAR